MPPVSWSGSHAKRWLSALASAATRSDSTEIFVRSVPFFLIWMVFSQILCAPAITRVGEQGDVNPVI